MDTNFVRLAVLACVGSWLCPAGSVRGAETMVNLGTVVVDKYQAQVFFHDPADDAKGYRITVAIAKPWDAPAIKSERIDAWLLARGGKALAVKERPRAGVLVEAGSRGASANAIFLFARTAERGELAAVVVAVDGQPKAFPVAPPKRDPEAPWPSAPKPRADGLPVGQWQVTFAEGMTGTWTIKQDEANSVVKDKWSFAKKPVAQDGAFVIRYDDRHVERWTRVGGRMVVERWPAAAQFPSGKPLLGIADKRQVMSIRDGTVVGDVFPDQFVTRVKKQVSPKGPTFVFEVYQLVSYSNFLYRIDVCNAEDTLVLQSVEFANGVPLGTDPDALQIADVNGDGYLDIKVLGGRRDGKAWYKVWLYEPAKGQFVWSEKGN